MSGEHLLAIDNGTQSVRAMIFDLRGNLVAKHVSPLNPIHPPHQVLQNRIRRFFGTRYVPPASSCGCNRGWTGQPLRQRH